MIRARHLIAGLLLALGTSAALAQSIYFIQNATADHQYMRHVAIPNGFGAGECLDLAG